MMQVPTMQPQQNYVPPLATLPQQPSYNAVKIDVHNPQVNAPGFAQPQAQQAPAYSAPIYAYPQANTYEYPQQQIYTPQQNFNAPAEPTVVPPTVVQTPVTQPVPPAPVIVEQAVPQAPAAPAAPVAAPTAQAPTAEPQKVEVQAPVQETPKVDVNAFLSKLNSENYDEQANAMESIADLAQNSPEKAADLLDVKVIDTLLGIMNKDTSKLAGPTPKQLEIREKIINKQPVSEAEQAEANTITPMEQAERNKQYSMYTTAILQKLYSNEIQKLNNTVVPLTELPGAVGIVEQVKNNPNPMVRASGIDALSYIQRPEYKQDLSTLFSIAQNDQDANVKEAATKAIEKLNKLEAEQAAAPATPAPEAAKA